MGKVNDSVVDEESENKISYSDRLNFVNVIAKPMADKKLTKKLYKVVKKANKEKGHVLNGIKAVQKGIRKDQKGLVILAGDVTPMEMMIHLPSVCEDKDLPYVFVPSREDLGAAMGNKRPSVMVMVKLGEQYQEAYDKCLEEVKELPTL